MIDCLLIQLNYNSISRYGYLFEKSLDSLMDSVYQTTQKGYSIGIIFADNASTDDTLQVIRNKIRKMHVKIKIKIIKFDKNYGFAEGNNKAYLLSKKYFGESRYIIFINPDVLFDRNWLVDLLGFMDDNTEKLEIGLVQPLTLPQKMYINNINVRKIINGLSKNYRKTKILPGHCIATNAKFFEKIGGWDTAFYIYGEDVDLSLKSLAIGKANLLFYKSIIYHDAHLTSFGHATLCDIVTRSLLFSRYIDSKLKLILTYLKFAVYDLARVLYRLYKNDGPTSISIIKAYKLIIKWSHIIVLENYRFENVRKKITTNTVESYFYELAIKNIYSIFDKKALTNL